MYVKQLALFLAYYKYLINVSIIFIIVVVVINQGTVTCLWLVKGHQHWKVNQQNQERTQL